MAFCLALIARYQAQGTPKDMTLVSFTSGFESDVLIGAGMVSQIRTCYAGLEAFGLAPHFTKMAGEGTLNIIEETEASLAYGLKAAISDVGFMPSKAWSGTDLFELRPDVKKVTDPYSGEEYTAFPPVECDLAVIHALEADAQGNANIGGNWGVDRELALVADKVLITAEKIVPTLSKADILGLVVTHVVEAPGGAWPTSCHPLYPLDGEAALAYTETVGKSEYPELIRNWGNKHRLTISE